MVTMAGASLKRLEVSYNQTHDRLILILHMQDFSEYLFWLTRRAVPIFWKVLTQLIQADEKTEHQRIKEKEHWAEAIEKEKGQKQQKAEQFSTRVATRPMGDEPLLLSKIQAKPGPNGTFHLHLEDVQGKWIELNGNSSVLVALCQLIQQLSEKAEWNLDLKLPG